MAIGKYKMDMTCGYLPAQIAKYMVPLAMTYLLQLTFHATDLIVIGRYSSPDSVAAIGTTGTTTALFVNLFVGMSVGANALVAQLYGAKNRKQMIKATHTAILISLIAGLFIIIAGQIAAVPMLKAIDVPEKIMPLSKLYLRICFLGSPAVLLYNFGCAILRAIGDTRRPLAFLIFSGVVNVLLNLILVCVFKMDVAGVAIATVISQILSAFLVIRVLVKSHGASRLYLQNLRIDLPSLRKILTIGIPAGIQSSCFALSNLLIQGAVNSFGAAAMAATTIVGMYEWLLYSWCYSLHQTIISFAGQNYGAKEYKRIGKSVVICLFYAVIITIVIGQAIYWNSEPLVNLFIRKHNPEICYWAKIRMKYLLFGYFLLAMMDVLTGSLRGIGHSIFPMIVTITGACLFRIWWVKAVFPTHHSMEWLTISYPISWFAVALLCGTAFLFIYRKMTRKQHFFSTRRKNPQQFA